MNRFAKVFRAVKIDHELLNEEQVELLSREIASALMEHRCPGDFIAGTPKYSPEVCEKMHCYDCWDKEA